jgi:PAS domain S-box-containing protein
LRVAVIEDDQTLLELAEVLLRAAGHEVLRATDGPAGVELVTGQTPDLVLLDLMLPGCDGFEVLERLARAGLTDRIPVVVISALVAMNDRRRGLEAGAAEFLPKPYSPDELIGIAAEFEGMAPEEVAQRRARALISLEGDERSSAVTRGPTAAWEAAEDPTHSQPLAGVLDLSVDAIITIDADQRIVGFNRGAEQVFGFDREEMRGEPLDRLLPPHLIGVHQEHVRGFGRGTETARHMGERREINGRRRDGSLFPAEASILKHVADGRLLFTAVLRDVSERKQLIDELRSRAGQQAAIAALGQRALSEGQDLDRFLQEVVGVVRSTLGVDLVTLARLRSDRLIVSAMLGPAGRGDGVVELERGRGSHAGYVLEVDRPVLTADLRNETRFRAGAIVQGMVSGAGVPIPGARRQFGTLSVYSSEARTFTDDDVHFLQAAANVVAALVDRSRVEARLRRFLDAAPDATLVVDVGGRVVSANPQAVELLGHEADELIGMEVEHLVPARFREAHAAYRAQYRSDPRLRTMGAGRELSVLRADGSEVAVDIMLNPLETEEGMLVVAAMRDVTERRRMEETREAFLRAVSHDLRTPLTALAGFARLLAQDEAVSDEHRGYVERILASARKLERLLGNLLDLDRLGRGVLQPSRRPTSLVALVEGVAASGVLSSEHPLEVEVAPDAEVASVDPAQIERILENLLVNVSRHTPAGTPCRIAVQRRDQGILLTVEDQGPGISPDERGAIFDPFQRGQDSSHSPGTGVGLSLVARFAELHDGRAWVEERPGGGARFHVLVSDG